MIDIRTHDPHARPVHLALLGAHDLLELWPIPECADAGAVEDDESAAVAHEIGDFLLALGGQLWPVVVEDEQVVVGEVLRVEGELLGRPGDLEAAGVVEELLDERAVEIDAAADAAAVAHEEQGLELAGVLGPASVGDGLDADALEVGHAAVGLETDVALERRHPVDAVVDALAVEIRLVAVAHAGHRDVVPLAWLRGPASGAVGVEQVARAMSPHLLVVVELHLVGRARGRIAAGHEPRATEEEPAVVPVGQAEPQVPHGIAEGLLIREARAAAEALDHRLAVFLDHPPVLARRHPAAQVPAIEQLHPSIIRSGSRAGRQRQQHGQQHPHDNSSVTWRSGAGRGDRPGRASHRPRGRMIRLPLGPRSVSTPCRAGRRWA